MGTRLRRITARQHRSGADTERGQHSQPETRAIKGSQGSDGAGNTDNKMTMRSARERSELDRKDNQEAEAGQKNNQGKQEVQTGEKMSKGNGSWTGKEQLQETGRCRRTGKITRGNRVRTDRKKALSLKRKPGQGKNIRNKWMGKDNQEAEVWTEK